MPKLGYALSSEEHSPESLVSLASQARDAGFGFAYISDHIHPWIDKQGHSPFVWSVIGAISQSVPDFPLATGVTCPILRIHPLIIAHAAATSAILLKGKFTLGLGTGENLNEHVVGQGWPSILERQAMLEESVYILRELWQGRTVNFFGKFYIVESAKIYDLPPLEIPIQIAASGAKSATLAGELADGLIATSPDPKIISVFNRNGGKEKLKVAQITVCYHPDKSEAIKIAHDYWPNAALAGQLSQEIKQPSYFQDAVSIVSKEAVEKSIICEPSPQAHISAIKKYFDAGFDQVYVHQVGPDQDKFFEFYQREINPIFNN